MSLSIQKIKKIYDGPIEVAIKYYSIISILNNFYLAEREIQLLAFTSIRGNISYKVHKQEFADLFQSSVSTVNNMIGPLKKMGLLVLVQKKYKVNPGIVLDFEKKDIGLSIKLLKKTPDAAPADHK